MEDNALNEKFPRLHHISRKRLLDIKKNHRMRGGWEMSVELCINLMDYEISQLDDLMQILDVALSGMEENK